MPLWGGGRRACSCSNPAVSELHHIDYTSSLEGGRKKNITANVIQGTCATKEKKKRKVGPAAAVTWKIPHLTKWDPCHCTRHTLRTTVFSLRRSTASSSSPSSSPYASSSVHQVVQWTMHLLPVPYCCVYEQVEYGWKI